MVDRGMRLITLSVVLAVIGAACGDSAEDITTTRPQVTATTTIPPTASSASTTPVAPTTTTVPTRTAAPTTTLPGEPILGMLPEGAVLAVVGVSHDDALNVRVRPGVAQNIIATLDPLADDVVATGRSWSLPRSIWHEVTVAGTTGWARSGFLAYIANTDDATAEVVTKFGGLPTATTILDLGYMVVEALESGPEEEAPSTITVTVEATVGDLGEVTYDVVGPGDDSIAGFRLHIIGQPDGDGFSLISVERTYLCHWFRGVSEGLCL